MILMKYEELPSYMKNDYVKKYYERLSKRKFSLVIKRIFDILFSLLLLIILSPLMLVIAIMIKIDSKGPVFYKQERITQYGRAFKIFKFRTMVQNADKLGSLVTMDNDERITPIGKIIRKYRIDEIPQLINILIGDMSFVGTRPEVKKYVNMYTDEMKATLLMKAGVTSIASIKYKDEDKVISKHMNPNTSVDDIYVNEILPEKMKWNVQYIDDFNIITDLKTEISTLVEVIK